MGGSSASGGKSATGGATSAGGVTTTGGSSGKGGSSAAGSSTLGGATSSGGSSSVGGKTSTGGASSVGGTLSVGGSSSAGGKSSTGGTTTFGGSSSVGGMSSTGGTSALGTTVADVIERVYAAVETAPTTNTGDAADDPAFFYDPVEPAQSVVITTDKQTGGGLNVYALDGTKVDGIVAGRLNNVDLRSGVELVDAVDVLVTAANRDDNTLEIFSYDPVTRKLQDIAAEPTVTLGGAKGDVYGSCMYQDPFSGKLYYFVNSKAGYIEQYELKASTTKVGFISAEKVRDLRKLETQPEACVVDDDTGMLYVGEEDVGVWEFAADPSVKSGAGFDGKLIAKVGEHLVADVEGVAIAKTFTKTLLFVSSQGDSTFSVFDMEKDFAFVKRFQVARGPTCVDDVTESDGIEVSTEDLGGAFSSGVFITQDGTNDVGNQSFKLVPLSQILNGAGSFDDLSCK